MIYLITYDKNTALKNYSSLYEAIKSCSQTWWHHMNNTWLIASYMDVNQIYDRLSTHITIKDRLLIVELNRYASMQGYLNEDGWDWIDQHRSFFRR